MAQVEYKGITIDIIEEDGDYCFSYQVANHLYLGQFKTYEKALEVAMKDIEGLKWFY